MITKSDVNGAELDKREELLQLLLDHPEIIPAFMERVQKDCPELFTAENA